MGLDTVEIVMRCEEVFGVELPDSECGQVLTVGDLYGLICRHLGLEPVQRPDATVGVSKLKPQAVLNLLRLAWNAADVWATLVAIFVEQLQLEADEVKWWARLGADLGCE